MLQTALEIEVETSPVVSPRISGSDAARWLEEFQLRYGRPLRVLHVGNIANNAYNNAKVQRAKGIEAHVAVPDYYHVMGCPEWEDADFEGRIDDPMLPDFWAVNLKGFERPRWFAQGPLDICRKYLIQLNAGTAVTQQLYWRYLEAYRYYLVKPYIRNLVARTGITQDSIKRLATFVEVIAGKQLSSNRQNFSELMKATHAAEACLRASGGIAKDSTPNWHRAFGILDDDFADFHPSALAWMPLFRHYDVIQAYSTDPIWPFLCRLPNFVAYEHGTIREIPFQDDAIGRLTKIAYQNAPAVFITNVDNIKAADRLNLTQDCRNYLPHAFDSQKLLNHAEQTTVRYDQSEPRQFFMPSRQHWVDRDPNWAKGNDVVIRAIAQMGDVKAPFIVKFINWGKDVEASKQLIAELGISHRIVWSPMLNKRQLWDEYIRSAVVIDQFLLPGISGVSFEAMTLGRPVITCDEGDLNQRFFGKAPPLLTANTSEAVAHQLRRVILDEPWRAGVGESSAHWIQGYHSADRIFDIQVQAFRRVLEECGRA